MVREMAMEMDKRFTLLRLSVVSDFSLLAGAPSWPITFDQQIATVFNETYFLPGRPSIDGGH